jgi:hypothetical protein
MSCENCRFYAEGAIYPDGSAEHLCACPRRGGKDGGFE